MALQIIAQSLMLPSNHHQLSLPSTAIASRSTALSQFQNSQKFFAKVFYQSSSCKVRVTLHSPDNLMSYSSTGVRHFFNQDSFLNHGRFQNGGRAISYTRFLGLRERNRGISENRERPGSIQAVHDFGGRVLHREIFVQVPFTCIQICKKDSVQRNDAAITGPLVKPSPQFSAEEAVRKQLNALSENDNPRQDHGLEVLYYFSNTSGTFEGGSLPRYFGFAADLYHFGHFALKFKTRYPSLINFLSYEILRIGELEDFPPPPPLLNSFSKTVNNTNNNKNISNKNNNNSPTLEVVVKVINKNGSESFWVFNVSRVQRGILDPCWLTNHLLPYKMN